MGELLSRSPEETFSHGQLIGKSFQNELAAFAHSGSQGTPPPVSLVLLFGELGAGKTLWAKGFANGLGIYSDVYSPTFTILNEYKQADHVLLHLDLYRIQCMEELADIGIYEILESCCPVVIEWAERLPELSTIRHLSVKITEIEDGYRKISWTIIGNRSVGIF